jgi:hypothetical protein
LKDAIPLSTSIYTQKYTPWAYIFAFAAQEVASQAVSSLAALEKKQVQVETSMAQQEQENVEKMEVLALEYQVVLEAKQKEHELAIERLHERHSTVLLPMDEEHTIVLKAKDAIGRAIEE